MENEQLLNGYNPQFLIENNSSIDEVGLPILSQEQRDDLLKTDVIIDGVVKYINYTLMMSETHKFPFFTATNIDGLAFKKVPRKDRWRKDPRLADKQWGGELYTSDHADFDRGHMTKREDVQWGGTPGIAMKAADATFYYPNAVPQHKDLNRDVWKSLEDYILNTETKPNSLRVCVFTGPVLIRSNPYFITTVRGNSVQLPILFWKIIVFPKADQKIYRVGFLMSQNRLLREHGLIEELEMSTSQEELFNQFEDAATYQVNISLIEEVSGLTFPNAIDSYTDTRNTKLVFKEIDIDPDLESDSIDQKLGFTIENIIA